LRVARGLTQEALAIDAGIDRGYVSQIETKTHNPSVGVLDKIAIGLGIDIAELFEQPDPKVGVSKGLPSGRKRRDR